jgi:hypothetical protein
MSKHKTVVGYKQGDTIPAGANFLYAEWQEEQRVLSSDYYSNPSRRTYTTSEIKINYYEIGVEVNTTNEVY